jgi:hypothetical protein
MGLVSLAHLHCDAPRNNPLDPKNSNSTYAGLEGVVQTLSIPNLPIPQVKVFWKNDGRMVETSDDGRFAIRDLAAVDGWLLFSKDGYLADSLLVSWQNRKSVTVQMMLNALPRLNSLAIYSVILHRYPSLQTSQMIVQARVSDSDGDLDSVTVECTSLRFKRLLAYNVDSGSYEKTITTYDLGVKSLDQVVGASFEIKVRDKFSHRFLLGADCVKRIIRQEVEFDSPSGYQIVPLAPTLRWKDFAPGFDFEFRIEIFTDEISPQMVWEKSGISPDSTSFTVDRILPEGDYFWVIWCIDEYQNRSRSKPASFTVESNEFLTHDKGEKKNGSRLFFKTY